MLHFLTAHRKWHTLSACFLVIAVLGGYPTMPIHPMKKFISRVSSLLDPFTRRMDTQSIDDKMRRRKKKPALRWPMIVVVPMGILVTQVGFLSNIRQPEPAFNVSEMLSGYENNRGADSRSRKAQRESHGRKNAEAAHLKDAALHP